MTNIVRMSVWIIGAYIVTGHAIAAQIDLKKVSLEPMMLWDRYWFVKEFVEAYGGVYADKTFTIKTAEGFKEVGPKSKKEKESWLTSTANNEFADYVVDEKPSYKAYLIRLRQGTVTIRIGAILYRVDEINNELYLGQLFVQAEYQKKGIGKHVLTHILPTQYPDVKRYEVLARPQNDAANALYPRAGFTIAPNETVTKYGYDNKFYAAYYKDLH